MCSVAPNAEALPIPTLSLLSIVIAVASAVETIPSTPPPRVILSSGRVTVRSVFVFGAHSHYLEFLPLPYSILLNDCPY